MDRRAWRDFLVTLALLGTSFVIALLSSAAAEQHQGQVAWLAAAVSLLLALIGALYIIPRLARKVQLEFLRFAVRTSITAEGVFFIVFLVVVGFAAWNTANNLLYLILSAMLAFVIAANFMARMTLADISVQLRFPDHVFAGEPASLSVTILNHKKLIPSYSLIIEALTEDRNSPLEDDEEATDNDAASLPPSAGSLQLGKLAHFVLVPARSSARKKLEHTFRRRGRYPITAFRISTKFPAGLLKKWRNVDATGDILVYPKPRPLDDFYHALPMLSGQVSSLIRGSGDELFGIRRYHPSDHMHHIDWKATAKSMKMMVREHTREDERRLTIVFDTSRPSIDSSLPHGREATRIFEQRFERAVVMAASLANHFILERADVELIVSAENRNVESGTGLDHLYRLLRSLAELEPDRVEQETRSGGGLFSRLRRRRKVEGNSESKTPPAPKPGGLSRLIDKVPSLADERRFKVLITPAAKGTIPANVWRSAHVVFMEDL